MPRPPSPSPRYLEDVAVGDRFRSLEHVVTVEEMTAFARSYDPQPMHVDAEAARAGPFGTLVASGWYTLSLTMRLMVESRPFGATPVVGMGVDGIRFERPVHPGARLRAEAEVIDVRISRNRGDRGYVRLAVETFDDAGEIVLRQEWRLLVPTRPA